MQKNNFRRLLFLTVILLLSILLLSACGQGQSSTPTAAALSTESGEPGEVPKPSNPGGPGDAVNLKGDPTAGAEVYAANCATCHGDQGKGGVDNPGSTDGTVPPVAPIDPGLKSSDPKVFAQNIDLFIQHGSTPEGSNPAKQMPGWGDTNALTQQQIADVIAYIISLNK